MKFKLNQNNTKISTSIPYPKKISKDKLVKDEDIIKNFSNMVRNFAMKETEWQISKENYEKKIAQLEGELKAHENINIDLLKRIRMNIL